MAVATPTLKNRIESMDVLRGVAILGILLANIWTFGWPQLAETFGTSNPVNGTNFWVEGMRVCFVTGKFRGLLCLLFGAGLHLQYLKLSASGEWPGVYLRRTGLLTLIGAIHLLLIWYGDVLFVYSLTAFIAMWFVKASNRAVLGTSFGLMGLSAFIGLSQGFGALVAGPTERSASIDPLERLWSATNELRVFQGGSYGEQFGMRLPMMKIDLVYFPILFFELGGLFLFGLWMSRKGLFAKPSSQPVLRNILLAVGAVGLIVNFLLGVTVAVRQDDSFSMLVEYGANMPLAIGYAICGAVLVEKFPRGWLAAIVAPVGRMALSCYLMQSVLCTVFFYSWGGGMFGKLNYWGLYAVAFAVWGCNFLFAHLWLKRFKMGPVEWIWRTVSLGKNASRPAAESGGNVPPLLNG